MPDPAIEVEGLRFEYPGIRALDDISFCVERSSVTALVGPNGAGKTTLLRCLAGLDQPMLGAVRVADIDVLEEPRLAHRKMGLLSDFFGLYDNLTVRQCLSHAAAANGVDRAGEAATVERAAARLEITDKLDALAGSLSRGQRQRVAIGQALVHGPEVLLLDEPASGLDPEARVSLAGLFQRLRAEGVTLLVSSHILAELDAYSTHMLVLREGRMIENRALTENATRPQRRIRIELAQPGGSDLRNRLAARPGVRLVESDEQGALIELAGGTQEEAALLAYLVGAGVQVCGFAEVREDLQASYLRTVREGGAAGGATR
ncbi:MAG: ABC transporter ATP-binding protein, partial [Burkholderiales bacterium]